MAGHGMADHAAVPSLEMTVKTGITGDSPEATAQESLCFATEDLGRRQAGVTQEEKLRQAY